MSYKNADNVMIQSVQVPWISAGSFTAQTSVVFPVTARKVSDVVADANRTSVMYKIPPAINTLNMRVSMPADNNTATLELFAARLGNAVGADSELIRICTVTATAGTQPRIAGGYLADTMTVTDDNWFTDVRSCVPAAEHQAMIMFDTLGFDVIVVHGHTSVTGIVTVEFSGV